MDDFENKNDENNEDEVVNNEDMENESQQPTPYEPEPLPDMAEFPPVPEQEEGVAEEPPAEDESKEPEMEEPAVREESKVGRWARNSLRWVLGFFIVFGIGFLVALFALYRPDVNSLKGELETANTEISALQSEIDALQSEISDLEGQIQGLEGVQEQVDELQGQLDENEMEMLILRARQSVAQARIALFSENENQFSLYWDTTMDSLSRIKERLPSAQQDAISPLEQRMMLVSDEFQESPEAAQSDLEIVGNRLLELQDTLFGGP